MPAISFEISGEDVDMVAPNGGRETDLILICTLCNFCMPQYEVTYMYRDKAFCSSECRSKHINVNNCNAVDAAQEVELAWLEKFRLRKKLNVETAKVLEEKELKGLEFAIGAYTARRRKISSPFQVIREQKCTKKRSHREKRKLKNSNEHLLSPQSSQPNVIMQSAFDSSQHKFMEDHIINLHSSIQNCSQVNHERFVHQESSRITDSVELTILLVTLALEAFAAILDQISSPSRPYFALIGAILSLIALFICIAEIVHKARKARVVWRRKDKQCWFWLYHPFPRDVPFGSLVDGFGFACAIVQCIFSGVEYTYFVRHANNPIKLCILPAMFVLCLIFSRLNKNHCMSHTHVMYDMALPQQEQVVF